MGEESSMISVESGMEAPMGSENELLRIRGTQLCLVDAKESVVIQRGDFAFHVIKQNQSPLAAVVGMVGDLQWPLGKDSPALKVGTMKYAFALPNLVYGLILPANTPLEAEQSLEGLLQQYSAYEQHEEIWEVVNESKQSWLVEAVQEAAICWTWVAPHVDKITAKMLHKMQRPAAWTDAELLWTEAVTEDQETDSAAVGSGGDSNSSSTAVSARMQKRIQRARRMSAVAKLLSKTLLRGAINAERHIRYYATATLHSDETEAEAATLFMVTARVEVFAKVVEAVEAAGKSLFDLAEFQHKLRAHAPDHTPDHHGDHHLPSCPENTWTLNRTGLGLLLRATAVSAVIHVARGFGGAANVSSTQSSSSPQSVLSQQPSDPPSLNYAQYSGLPTQTQQFIPTPTVDAMCSVSLAQPDSAFPSSSTGTRVPHRPNSPFQQYNKSNAVGDTQSFHFSLGFDTKQNV